MNGKKLELSNRSTPTTELIDKFMDGDYRYLILGTYRFLIGKKKHKGKRIPEFIFVKFYIPKEPDLEEMDRLYKFPKRYKSTSGYRQISSYTMTDMKMILGGELVYTKEFSNYTDIESVLKETFEDNFEDIRNQKKIIVRLNRPFIIKAQDSLHYYANGYGREYHTLYVTHVEFDVF